jgi:hypothetical protein
MEGWDTAADAKTQEFAAPHGDGNVSQKASFFRRF